jgi:hypothetical protein
MGDFTTDFLHSNLYQLVLVQDGGMRHYFIHELIRDGDEYHEVSLRRVMVYFGSDSKC